MPQREPTPKSEETRAKLLDSALSLFRERGFSQATMRDIAARAGLSAGLAYYYFDSKEALVTAFYMRAQREIEPLLGQVHGAHRTLGPRLAAIVRARLDYFAPDRGVLGALLGTAADPRHPLSPFSAETRAIRDADIAHFQRALDETGTRVPKDLALRLARILWAWQMGIILYWIHDASEQQERTRRLIGQSLRMALSLIRLSNLPLLRPARRAVLEIVTLLEGGEDAR